MTNTFRSGQAGALHPAPDAALGDPDQWTRVAGHRPARRADRTDVLTYVSEPLTAPLKIAGVPKVNLTASTSGTDSDWVVKLIDVYPDEVPASPSHGRLPADAVGMDIFRGRYRESFSEPKALAPNKRR
jgi:predicted acyl esterase